MKKKNNFILLVKVDQDDVCAFTAVMSSECLWAPTSKYSNHDMPTNEATVQ